MEVQNTRTSEARPKRKEKNKTRPEPRKYTKDPTLAPFFRHYAIFFVFFRLYQLFRYFATQCNDKRCRLTET